MGTYKVQDETGPWWVVGTFDAAWSVVRVRAVAERGEALVDTGTVKVLRLLDEPFTDWREASLIATRLERAYAGKTRLGKQGRPDRAGVTRRTVMALHVDRNPPTSENRPVTVEGPGSSQTTGGRSGFNVSRELKTGLAGLQTDLESRVDRRKSAEHRQAISDRMKGVKKSEAHRQALSDAMKQAWANKPHPLKGVKKSEAHRQALSESMKLRRAEEKANGVLDTPEAKAKQSAASLKAWATRRAKGWTYPEEGRAKLSEYMKKKHLSEYPGE